MVMSYGGVLLTLRVNLGRLCESGMEMVGRVELAYSYIRKLRRKLEEDRSETSRGAQRLKRFQKYTGKVFRILQA